MQIDHILIDRFLNIYLCESKHFSEGVAINDLGEFTAFFKSKPYGVPSAIAQNDRHIIAMRDFFKIHDRILPSRLGFMIKPSLSGLVLVSKNARLSRPKTFVKGLDTVIKNDQLRQRIDKEIEGGSALQIVKAISSETLQTFAREIVKWHTPITFDWHGKFGLSRDIPVADVRPGVSVVEPGEVTVATKGATPAVVCQELVKAKPVPDAFDTEASAPKEMKRLICMKCNVAIEYKVARVCWFNKKRFGGNAYCLDCQVAFPK